MFEPGNPRPVVVDWQTAAWAGVSLDVAYFIGGCLSTEDRRAHEPDLLTHYHDALRRGGVSDYSLEQLRADTRLDTFGGVLMAIVAAMVVQRTERGDLMFLTSTTRHAQHAVDVDAPRAVARHRMTDLLVLCTGNAARSVMAGFMLEYLRDGRAGEPLRIVTVGTHTIDGQPMGLRTRTALARLPSSPGPTSADTAAARSMASTSCTPSSWSSWRPIMCASSGASSPMPRPRRPPSAICAAPFPVATEPG